MGGVLSVQIDQIFNATAENIWQFLQTAGQGCYIPAYQRPYAWDQNNVDRLIEDAINGLNHLEKRNNAISFLGTIIAIHDIKNVTVKPVFKAEVAPRVMTLIDGQQRISTAVMLNIALHNQISQQQQKITKGEGEHFDWIKQQAKKALAELKNTFCLDQTTGDPEIYRFYPRVIRAFDDAWSTRGSQAIYSSPIAKLTWNYIKHIEEKNTSSFSHTAVDDGGNVDPKHQSIAEVFRYMGKSLAQMTEKKSDEFDFPNLQQAIQNDNFTEALWSFPAPDEVKMYLTVQSDDKLYDAYSALIRSIVFHRYFNMRMALTIVTTRSEDDAFDMFEALNTTGEPLTAFETFKPNIIDAEGLTNYQESISFKNVSRIESYLDQFKKADERQKATSELLIPYALAETGDRLQKALGDQRRYLRDYFKNLKTLDEKREAVGSLANIATFVKTAWAPQDNIISLEQVGPFDHETGFCFQALRALKHTVVLGPLSRFYDEVRRTDNESRAEKKADLAAAIKAVTAFSMLWRGAYGTTQNIDSVYRSIMREGLEAEQILPLARRSKGTLGAVSLHSLKRILWAHFQQAFPDPDTWLRAAAKTPIYRHSKVVAKFLLIVAMDDAALDQSSPGLIIRGTKNLAPTINAEAWTANNNYSVEHIAPQSHKPAGWLHEIYDDKDTCDRLGNLTLLSGELNSYLGKRSWQHKALLYKYFASQTPSEAEEIQASFEKYGLNVTLNGTEILANMQYTPMCRAIASVENPWTTDLIERRSERLAELVYQRLIDWLTP